MRTESLHEVIHAEPFRPFRLILANGRDVPVPHPDWVWLRNGTRTLVWMDELERVKILDIALILGVEMDEPTPAGRVQSEPNGGVAG